MILAHHGNSAKKDELIIEDNTMVYFVDDVFTVNKKCKRNTKNDD